MVKSAFNPNYQNSHLNSKIVVALERISEAFRVLLWHESKINSLSPIQVQILIFLLFHPKEKCKVSYLAQEFNMTKATISDSIKTLIKKALVKKEIDVNDVRQRIITLTKQGESIAQKSSYFSKALEKPLDYISQQEKEQLHNSLIHIISNLNQAGVVSTQRMCLTCANYVNNKGAHYCNLLQSPLATEALRLDCPEHQEVVA